MAKRLIVAIGEQVLREVANPVTEFNERLCQMLDDMAETMYANNGVGLAANQIGILKRAVVVDIGQGLIELVNPVVVKSKGQQVGVEGCLSVQGIHGEVVRPKRLVVRAQDRSGTSIQVDATEYLAVAISHEMDHLNGILFVDKMIRNE